MWFSGTLYPSAHISLVTITSVPVDIARYPGGSNFKNQRWPSTSFTVKPGVMPSLLDDVIVHVPGAGPALVFGPASTSSGVRSRCPARLVNQLEFGSSSTELRFCARTGVCASTRLSAFDVRSTNRLISIGFMWEASCVSRSIQIGSSSKNFDDAAVPMAVNSTAVATATAAAVSLILVRVIDGSSSLECEFKSSEAWAEGKHDAVPFCRSREIDACHRGRERMQRQPDAVAFPEATDS